MRLAVELLGGLLAVTVLLVGVAAWRLSEGPVRTNFLTPYLQAAINRGGGNTIEIGSTFLVWEEGTRGLVFHAAEIVVRDAEEKLLAALPEVAFELSTSAILAGTLAPNQIEVIAPRIRLLRARNGTISFGEEEAAPPEDAPAQPNAIAREGEDVVLGKMIGELLAERQPGNPLSYLNEVRIRDGQIYVRDELLGISWAAPAADISLRRDVAGLAGDLSLGFTGQSDPATFDAAFLFDKNKGVVDFAASFSDISLAALGQAIPLLAPVRGLTSRISGSVSTSLSLDGKVGHTGFDLKGFAGTLKIPGLDMPPVPVRDLTMRGRYDSEAIRFDLHEARIQLGSEAEPGPLFSISGLFDHSPAERGWEIEAQAALEGVPLKDLDIYWPKNVAPGARPWVTENVTAGMVDRATAELKIVVPQGDFSAAQVTQLAGTMNYRDLVVHYLRPLPPVEGIAGTANYDADALRFAVTGGRMQELTVGESKVVIDGFAKADSARGIYEQLTIEAKSAGPVHEALSLLEHPRLDLLSTLGFSAEGSGGTMTADLQFRFPLSKDLAFDDVDLKVEAAIQDGRLHEVLLGQDMTEGRLDLSVDQSGMQIAGPLQLGGVPLTVSWKESFTEKAEVRSVMEAQIPHTLDEDRARFGLDIGDAVRGPLASTVSMVARSNGLTSLRISADLKEATMSLPEVHWQKTAGTEGSLSMQIELDDAGPLAYRDIVLQAGDLVARGSALPGEDREGLSRVDLEQVAFGRSNLRDVVLQIADRGIEVDIGQGILDAAPFRADDPDETEAGEARSAEQTRAAVANKVFEPLDVRAPNLEVLYFAEEQRLEQVNMELRRGRRGWETIRLSGSIPKQYWSPREAVQKPPADGGGGEVPAPPQPELDRRYLQLSFASDSEGSGKRLLASSDDLGALLRATNIADTVVGGRIQVTGSSDGPTPTHPIKATVAARDFVMVRAPALAKLLTVASFTGMRDLLSGSGITFQGLDGDFVLDNGVASTEQMRVYGAALGITAKGDIDFDRDAIDLTGVVVPAYSINDFLNKIPLLGTILTGGPGEGLIAVSYSVKGAVEDPQVAVNPLTALTPGFLRKIFTSAPETDENQSTPSSRPPEHRD